MEPIQTPIEDPATHDLAWFRDNVGLWAGDDSFSNAMIRQALITFQMRLADESAKRGITVDCSPMFTVFDYDDCPARFADVLDEDFEGPEPDWKWDHYEEGAGDVTEVFFGDPNTDEIPYDIRTKGLVISLGGSAGSSAQTFYLIPIFCMEKSS